MSAAGGLSVANVNDGSVTDADGLYVVPVPDEFVAEDIVSDSSALDTYIDRCGHKVTHLILDSGQAVTCGPDAGIAAAREVSAAALPYEDVTALVTSEGDLLRVDGEIEWSSTMPGCVLVETPFGPLYIDGDAPVLIVT